MSSTVKMKKLYKISHEIDDTQVAFCGEYSIVSDDIKKAVEFSNGLFSSEIEILDQIKNSAPKKRTKEEFIEEALNGDYLVYLETRNIICI